MTTSADPADAPPLGRSAELAVVLTALENHTADHALVRSGPAQGRTSLLSFLARHLTAHGDGSAFEVIATDCAGPGALPAITQALVDAGLGEHIGVASPTRPTRRGRTSAPTSGPRGTDEPIVTTDAITTMATRLLSRSAVPPVIAVDDAHLLDDTSAHVLRAIAQRGGTLVLGTGRADPLPTVLRPLAAAGRLHEVGLEPLGDGDVARLATTVLIGPIEPVMVKALTRLVGGAPAAIIDVLHHARATGRIQRLGHVWRLTGRLDLPAATIARAEGLLGRLTADELVVVDLLALADQMSLELLEQLADPEVIERLEIARLVTIAETDGAAACEVRLTDPVIRSVRRQVMPGSRRRRTLTRLLAQLERTSTVSDEADGEHVATASMRDPLLVANVATQLGHRLDPDLARTAARAAHRTHDDELAEDLARIAWTGSGDLDDALLLAEILTLVGRNREAEELLEGLTATTQDQLALLAMTRAVNLGQYLEQVDHGQRVLDEAIEQLGPGDWTAEITGLRAVTRLLEGDPTLTLALVDAGLATGEGRSFVEAATAVGPALIVQGRHLDAAELAARAFEERTRLGDQPFLTSPGLHALVRSLALAEAGCFREADELSGAVMQFAAAMGDRDGQAWAGIIGGRALLDQGRVEEACEWFEMAASASIVANRVQHLRWSRAGVLLATAQTGDSEGSRRALDALDSCPPTSLLFMEPEVDRARAWAHVARHDLTRGRTLLVAAADRARDVGQPGLEIRALHDLIRLSDTREVGRLVSVGEGVQGDLARLRVAHGSALAADDAEGLVEVSIGFEELGALPFAAEAANQACWLQRRDGRPAAADASRRRTMQLRAQCPGFATPALDPLPGIAWLTAREREVTMAAAAGSPSKEIAAQLGVSVRTVDNLLQRSYRKLGLHGRAELRALRLTTPS